MHQRGKLIILLMFLLALALSGYAWWHRYQENPLSKQFWGSQATFTIRRAPKVEFFSLTRSDSRANTDADSITIDGESYMAVSRDISNVPGLVHARHALTDDHSFVWATPKSQVPAEWEFGLRFRDSSEQITVIFDKDGEEIYWLEQEKRLQLVPLSSKAFRKKRADWETVPVPRGSGS